jgi:molybdenum cofactor cytidylyltransferase
MSVVRCTLVASPSTFRSAIVLAAGASQRMGRPKALLPWRGTTLLEHVVQQARLAGVAEIVVVLGPATHDLELDAIMVINPDPATGRSASIRLGAAALADTPSAVLVQSVDQPVSAEILRQLFRMVEAGAEIALPVYSGRRGHPVVLSERLLTELRNVSEESEGLRAVVRAHPVTEVQVEDESVVWNLNDPAAYAAAHARR